MFHSDSSLSWKILDVFYVERKGRDISEKERIHTSISYRLEGNSTLQTQKQSIFADGKSVTYIPEALDYRRSTSGEEKLIVIHLKCYGKGEKEIEIQKGAEGVEPLFREMLKVWERKDPSSYNQCMLLLYRIFQELARMEEGVPSVPAVIEAGVRSLFLRFREPNLSVEELAEECFVSQVYFRRIFRAHFGVSPLQKLLDLRFHHACRLLRSGYHTVAKAAFLSGFSDVKYFRSAFKQRFGVSPSAYAKGAPLLTNPEKSHAPEPSSPPTPR